MVVLQPTFQGRGPRAVALDRHAVAKGSRAEEACRGYRVYADIETPNSFIFIEEWENLDDLYRHYQTPHFAEFFAALPEVLAGSPEGTVYQVASTLTLTDSLAAAGVSA